MKTFIKKLLVMLILGIMVGSVSACSFLSSGTNGSLDGEKQTPVTKKITVYNGETPVEYTLTCGEEGQITVPTKPGEYFVGAYDAKEGGVKYFDIDGKSTVIWAEDKPTVFYSRFASIYDINFTQLKSDESPYSWHSGGVRFVFEFSDEMKNAVLGNLDADLNANIKFEVACDEKNWKFTEAYVTNLKSGGTQYAYFDGDDYLLQPSPYKKLEKTFTLKSKMVKEGNMYFYIEAPYTIWENVKFHVKNVQLTVNFKEPTL